MPDLMSPPETRQADSATDLKFDDLLHQELEPGASGPGIVTVLLRRWKLLTFCALVSAAIGYVVGERYCLHTWQAEGTLLYSPFPIPDNLRGVYTPPSSQTLITLVKSPHNFEKLRKDFELSVPLKLLDKQFRVTQPVNAEIVTVTLDWAEPESGAAMVNRIMQLHIEHIADLRRARIEEGIRNQEETVARSRAKLAKARAAYERFEAEVKVTNISIELDRLEREASSLEQTLAIPRSTIRTLIAQQAKLDEYLDGLATGAAAGAEPPEGNDKPFQTRRLALRDLIQSTEFKHLESIKEYEAKLQAYNVLRDQARLRISSKTELDAARADLEIARIRRDNNLAAIQKFKDEMKTLPRGYAQARSADLREQIASLKIDIVNTEKNIVEKRQQAKQMLVLLRRADPLTKAVKEAEDEVAQLESQLIALRRMNTQEANEFVIETPAVAMTHPTASNRKKLTLAGFSLPMLLVLGLLIVYERRAVLGQYLREMRGE